MEITYIGELKHHETEGIRFTIPTKIAPRYGPATSYDASMAHSARDSSGIKITVDVSMPDGTFIKGVQSPSHPIAVSMGAVSTSFNSDPVMSKASATLSLGSASLDQDFVLIVQSKDVGKPQALLETHKTLPNQRALMVTLTPKFSLPASRPEIVFVADRSGSMSSNIPMLISAMNVFLKSMPAGVKFNICSFGSSHTFLWPRSQSYTKESLTQATQHVKTFSANYGGTETFSAMKATIEARYGDIPLEIILLTDGDISRQAELFVYVTQQVEITNGNIRVFPLGIGNGVSHSLIEGLARAGNGFAQAVQIGERLDNAVVRMLRGALSPHITDYTLEVKYEPESNGQEQIDFVTEGMKVLLSDDERSIRSERSEKSLRSEKPTNSPKAVRTISLFDDAAEPDKIDIKGIEDSKFWLPHVPHPKLLQAPQKIPSLFAFSRTTVYLIMSPDTVQRKPISVTLRGTSAHGPLALDIPVEILATKAETIHQLAAKKAVQDLEEGRGWIYEAKDQNGTLIQNRYPSCFQELVQQEAVRLGEKFQIAGKWCSFVAVAANDEEIAAKEAERRRSSKHSLTTGMIRSSKLTTIANRFSADDSEGTVEEDDDEADGDVEFDVDPSDDDGFTIIQSPEYSPPVYRQPSTWKLARKNIKASLLHPKKTRSMSDKYSSPSPTSPSIVAGNPFGSPTLQNMMMQQPQQPEQLRPQQQMMAQMAQLQPRAPGPTQAQTLQDYQMQLMLLEQQNKKRLVMSRQEQDSMAPPASPQPPPARQSSGSAAQDLSGASIANYYKPQQFGATAPNAFAFNASTDFSNSNGASTDVLQDFDFDSFLHQDTSAADTFSFGTSAPLQPQMTGSPAQQQTVSTPSQPTGFQSAPSIFSSIPPGSGRLSSSLFSTTSASSSGGFGASTPPPGSGLFASSPAPASGGLFGSLSQQQAQSSLFGAQPQQSSSVSFGNAAPFLNSYTPATSIAQPALYNPFSPPSPIAQPAPLAGRGPSTQAPAPAPPPPPASRTSFGSAIPPAPEPEQYSNSASKKKSRKPVFFSPASSITSAISNPFRSVSSSANSPPSYPPSRGPQDLSLPAEQPTTQGNMPGAQSTDTAMRRESRSRRASAAMTPAPNASSPAPAKASKIYSPIAPQASTYMSSAYTPLSYQQHNHPSFSQAQPAAPINWALKSLADKVLALIDLQDFEGFWAAGTAGDVVSIFGWDFESGDGEGGRGGVRWVTLLVVCWLEEKAAAEEGTWGLVVEKARAWLEAQPEVEGGIIGLERKARNEVRRH